MLSENIPAVDMHSIRHRRPTSHPAVGSHRPLSIKSLERVVGKLACAG
jgi:hypothetical protein